ncbi:MAG: hypothetical protein ABJQ34_10585 [Paracoccaceae bacterium]
MRSLRMSPEPRKKPAAFENVGAAVIVVAANAPSSARRVKPVELDSVISLRRPVRLPGHDVTRPISSHPQMQRFYGIARIVNQVINAVRIIRAYI